MPAANADIYERMTSIETQFVTFSQGMAEFRGALTAEMRESQRQRDGLFRSIEEMSRQLIELAITVRTQVERDEEWRHRIDKRLSGVEEDAEELADALKAPAPPHTCAPAPPAEEPAASKDKTHWYTGVVGGGGLLALVFGENIQQGIISLVEGIRKLGH